ncbi:UDP-N-acetylglucosamine 1-carboxyvinyltransferase 2 [Clostridia bacterium]|nr:UDP-N-acetylglucosamine 1-carboxyvinyltransferase 2 [Clostridia bacterium]
MLQYEVRGGRPLFGEVAVSGAKNAAVAIIPAALMVNGICCIENIPQISDVTLMMEILRELGAEVSMIKADTIVIDSRRLYSDRATPYELTSKLRASYYLAGALLARFGHAEVALPGGCDFGGSRPIDQHIKGFTALGADVDVINGQIVADAPNGLKGANVYMDTVSVGATINIMLAAALAEGTTYIDNAAREPHIVDLANFLTHMGAEVRGAGTDVIKIVGKKSLRGGTYTIIPDQIEAGTYMAAAAAAGGSVKITNVIPRHLECITAKLIEMGVKVEEDDEWVRVTRSEPLRRANIKTMPYPGFPTDMQPQLTAVLALARGTSVVTEGVWGSRYRYTAELRRMGAQITVNDKVAVIEGVQKLSGAPIHASDLRAGAALVVAALAAGGTTRISGVNYIERGYERMVEKLSALGADICRVDMPEADEQVILAEVS